MQQLDHIVVGATSLDAGVADCRKQTGIEIPPGGQHKSMGTHNALMTMGDQTYFELIAPDPTLPSPERPSWFSFDAAATQARLAKGISPLTWVVATDDLDRIVQDSPVALGEIVTMQRGDLTWRLTIHPDGALSERGLVPAFIQWPDGVHPTQNMQDKGVRLDRITLTHPDPAAFAGILAALGIAHLVTIAEGPHAMHFAMTTPHGPWDIAGAINTT